MKQILLLSLTANLLCANSITLGNLLENSKSAELFSQMIAEERSALSSKNLADTQTNPLTYNHAISKINGIGFSDFEQEVSFSKEFKLGNIQELEQQQAELNNEAYLIEQEKYMVDFNNRLKNLYHQYCLDRQYIGSFQEGYEMFLNLYEKKKIAYAEDEIAKTELLQLEFEKSRLEIELESLNRKEESVKSQLLSLSLVDTQSSLSCQDIYPITQQVNMDNETLSISQQAYEKRIESTQVGLERYSKKLESIEISMGYTKELDRDFYTVGVSIPLTMSSNKSEYERASLMHQSSALSLKNEQLLMNKAYKLKELKAKLSRDFQTIQAKQENIENYKSSLLDLMKKSYDYGESSVIEYLLSQQKLYALQQELLENKKGYYQTLFELYTVSETKDTK